MMEVRITDRRRWPDPVAEARQLLISTMEASPATSEDPWMLLRRYRRALSELVSERGSDSVRPATAAEAVMAAAIFGGPR